MSFTIFFVYHINSESDFVAFFFSSAIKHKVFLQAFQRWNEKRENKMKTFPFSWMLTITVCISLQELLMFSCTFVLTKLLQERIINLFFVLFFFFLHFLYFSLIKCNMDWLLLMLTFSLANFFSFFCVWHRWKQKRTENAFISSHKR